MNYNFWHVWTMPILLGLISLLGLVSALVGDNFLDLLSWITLTLPLAVIAWFVTMALKKKAR